MKAVVYRRYGTPDVLQVEEIQKPEVGDDEVLVRVHAASVNSWDWELLRGTPFLNRINGPLKPAHPILGADMAGRVDAVGRGVTELRPGDEVYGDLSGCGWGCFAEFVSARASALATTPQNLTSEQAAAVPQAGVQALQALRWGGSVQTGEHVLVNGGGGGVGTFAIQLAKTAGAEVTGVDTESKLDTMDGVGADHVLDYMQQDFTRTGARYDRIVDMAVHRSIFDYRRSLSPDGSCVVVGGSLARMFQILALGRLVSATGGPRMGVLLHKPTREDLQALADRLDAGTLAPVIDRTYELDEVPEALRYFGGGQVKGKLVISV